MEQLEAREVPALFTVTTLVDENNGVGGGVSLREAISQANTQAGDDAIQFSVTGTINLTGACQPDQQHQHHWPWGRSTHRPPRHRRKLPDLHGGCRHDRWHQRFDGGQRV